MLGPRRFAKTRRKGRGNPKFRESRPEMQVRDLYGLGGEYGCARSTSVRIFRSSGENVAW